MKKEDLIKKWLDNDLNQQELQEFEALEDYDQLSRISRSLKQFKAPEVDESKVLNAIISQNKKQKTSVIKLVTRFSQIAAIFLICFGVYYFMSNQKTTVSTVLAQKTIVTLPDNSIVHLNADSSIDFDENNWDEKRNLKLDGEAFFKVAKGSKFDVITDAGIVSVLGTQFNVKNRGSNFDVVCYEGLVSVQFNDKVVKLAPGDSFKSGNTNRKSIVSSKPSWINNESNFKSVPYINVIQEFERQYNVTVQTKNVDIDKLFTGRFVHNDIEIALKSITLPLKIDYSINGSKIILKSESPN